MTKFEKRCNEVAENEGVDALFFYNEKYQPPFEDDGSLHVVKNGVRAAFRIGQDTPPREYNETTRKILTALRMTDKTTSRVLVDETDNDDEEE